MKMSVAKVMDTLKLKDVTKGNISICHISLYRKRGKRKELT